MAKYKQYSVEQYETWLSRPFSDNYGISENDAVVWFLSQGGAKPAINAYGLNKSVLLNKVIPKLKAKLDGGYFLFLAITVAEGGGAANWINHWMLPDSGDGSIDATLDDDLAYIAGGTPSRQPTTNNVLNIDLPIAWTAPEVAGTAVEDNPGEAQRFYDSLDNGAIGKYYMPATMAGNVWVFASDWGLAHQGPSAPSVYFGNPYDTIINAIKSAGADPFDTSSTAKPNPGAGSPPKDKGTTQPSGNILQAIAKTAANLQNLLNSRAYDINDGTTYKNALFHIERDFNNTYRVKVAPDWNKINVDSSNEDLGIDPTPSVPEPDNSEGSIASGANDSTLLKLYKWANARQGQSFDFDGVWGAQCVDLITTLNTKFNLGLDLSGDYAGNIVLNTLPNDWKFVAGDPDNDANAKTIWNSLPQGAIVWFNQVTPGTATQNNPGHVGIKAGNWADTLQQNYGTDGGGGPILRANIAGWLESGGAGFTGAWVPK